MKKSLTKRQNDIYDFIRSRIETENFSPTIHEICSEFGIKSTNAVYEVLRVLEKKGYISRKEKGSSRAISLTDEKAKVQQEESNSKTSVINIIGKGNANNPMSVFLNTKGQIHLDTDFFGLAGGNFFAHIIEDNGMSKDGIFKGDLVLAEQRKDIESGSMVVALVEDSLMLRTFIKKKDGNALTASTRGFQDIFLDDNNVVIFGVVSGMVKKF
jgi:repressor LexA